MGNVTAGYVFSAGETVTPTKLNALFGGSLLSPPQAQPSVATVSTTSFHSLTTPPTITDGAQAWSQVITPGSASGRVLILHDCYIFPDGTSIPWLALFRGSTLIQCLRGSDATAGKKNLFTVISFDLPATTGPVTYSLRFGGDSTSSGGSFSYLGAMAGGEVPSAPVLIQFG
jgi:hypothetical protein